MMRWLLCVSFVSLVAGCGDPLSTVPRLADVELEETSEAATAVALPEAAGDERPLFERLLSKRKPQTEAPAAEAVAGADVDADADAGAEEGAAVVAETLSGQASESTAEAGEAAAALPAEETIAKAEPKEDKSLALFGFLRPKADKADTAEEQKAFEGLAEAEKIAPQTAAEAEVVTAAYSPEPEVREPPARKGLFSRRKTEKVSRAPTGPDAQEIAPGTALAFGQIARVCALPKAELGREVESSGKYRLYDSAVGSTAARPFYITGFDDGCPRQVTGALALFGTASSHEAMRYGKPFEGKPYSETDKAYEKAKREVCGAARGKPCGAQIKKLEKTTAFVTVYDQFVGAQNWHNVLLHNGAVLAMN